VDNVKWFLQNN